MKRNSERIFLVTILLFSSLLFFQTQGSSDVDTWIESVNNADKYGIIEGYAVAIDLMSHPPFMSLFTILSAKICALFGLSTYMGIKVSMYFFLLVTLIVLYRVTGSFFITVISYFLLMISSIWLVYLDIYFTPFLILSLFFLKKRKILLTTFFYCLAFMTKAQVIVIMPFYVLQILNISSFSEIKDLDYKKITLTFILPFSLIIMAILLIYGTPYLQSFHTAYKENMLSGEAINAGWIVTWFLHYFYPDSFGSLESSNYLIRMIRGGNALYSLAFNMLKYTFIVSFTVIFFKYFKTKDKSFEQFLLYTTAAFLSYFIFNKGVHENHLHIAVILLIILYGENKNYLIEMLVWGILFNINLIIFFGFGKGIMLHRVIGSLDLTLLFSFLSVVLYCFFILNYIFYKNSSLYQKKLSEG